LGESLHLAASRATRFAWRIDPRILPAYSNHAVVRAIRGAGADPERSVFGPEFKVTLQSDRMGVRLSGPLPPTAVPADRLSSAVAPGTVQLPPDGQPVVLMADAQTIGGYPQAAHVIAMDVPLVAQLRPGDTIRFTEVSLADAHRIALVREHSIAMLREGLAEKLN
jgi:antagonist of KipI